MKLSNALKKIAQLEAENSKLQQRLAMAEFTSFVPESLADDLIVFRKHNEILKKQNDSLYDRNHALSKELETVRSSLKNLKDFLNKKP